jgi:hypothetical protein
MHVLLRNNRRHLKRLPNEKNQEKQYWENEKYVSVIFVDAIFIHGQLLQSSFALNTWHGQL